MLFTHSLYVRRVISLSQVKRISKVKDTAFAQSWFAQRFEISPDEMPLTTPHSWWRVNCWPFRGAPITATHLQPQDQLSALAVSATLVAQSMGWWPITVGEGKSRRGKKQLRLGRSFPPFPASLIYANQNKKLWDTVALTSLGKLTPFIDSRTI